jgi:hypothetical protein
MFFYNIMRYSSRLIVARHGFESVTLDLAKDYHYYKNILARHDIQITRRLVIEELAEIAESNNDPTVTRRVLETRTPYRSPQQRETPVYQLNRTLAELELTLDQMAQNI